MVFVIESMSGFSSFCAKFCFGVTDAKQKLSTLFLSPGLRDFALPCPGDPISEIGELLSLSGSFLLREVFKLMEKLPPVSARFLQVWFSDRDSDSHQNRATCRMLALLV